jgi:hypothetical protein
MGRSRERVVAKDEVVLLVRFVREVIAAVMRGT